MITVQQLQEMCPNAKNHSEWVQAMNDIFPKYDINTAHRIAGFIAQTAHESNEFNTLSENLNYSADALNKIFPKYFVKAGRDAQEYHRQPEKIANVIYANRMGNGDEESGDGWFFRGGGILQLTGFNNYWKFGESIGITAPEATRYVRTPEGAIESACWFWSENNINKYCDNDDIVGMTKRINGGTIGLDDRKKHYNHNLTILGIDSPEPEAETHGFHLVKRGSKGEDVKRVQEILGLTPDGDFGPGTERSVKYWQEEHGLVPDGIVGPQTFTAMQDES